MPEFDSIIDHIIIGPIMPIDPKLLINISVPSKIIDYTFSGKQLANPDGTMPALLTGITQASGPGETFMGNFPYSIILNEYGKATVAIDEAGVNVKSFSTRVCFMVINPVQLRQNIVESDLLPFSVFLDRTQGAGGFKLVAAVGTQNYGWVGVDTEGITQLNLYTWYTADLIYDADTLSLFINERLIGVQSFPDGRLLALSGRNVYIGTWIDGSSNHYPGKIAGLQIYRKIPGELMSKAEKARTESTWFVSRKAIAFNNVLGNPTGPLQSEGFASPALVYQQAYQSGMVQYCDIAGAAFEMHGAIYNYYQQLSDEEKKELGYLISDETISPNPFTTGRKNVFQKGAIYFYPNAGAIHVTGQLYLDYEELGANLSYLGFPTSKASPINGGIQQIFEVGRMYYRDDAAKAFEVHGAILDRYLAVGGPDFLGYPVSNEADVIKDGVAVGKVSHFEYGAIYWSSSTAAYEVSAGEMGKKYEEFNGPIGVLGFPTSGTTNIFGKSEGWYNTFQNGSIVTLGEKKTYACIPFHIWVTSIDTKGSEGIRTDQNDLAVDFHIDSPFGTSHQRYPNDRPDSYVENQNIIQINQDIAPQIIPNDPSIKVTFRADIWDFDDGANDLIANYSHSLSIENAWGLAEGQGGSFTELGGDKYPMLNNIIWNIKNNLDVSDLKPKQRWWGVQNTGIDPISYHQFAAAFNDVDSEPETIDPYDWTDGLFYELVIKHMAKHGRCLGMCAQAISSWKTGESFSLPLNQFTDMDVVGRQFAIKHQLQVSAPALWWFVKQFLSGKTHDPVSVFLETQRLYNTGQNPVINIAQNADFSGAPHALLPYEWRQAGDNWQIAVFDPNFPSIPDKGDPTRFISINANDNTFFYDGGKKQPKIYTGSSKNGGRFFYSPWSVLNGRPHTPFWDAIVLLLSGTIMILGEDAQTESLTDPSGTNLDYFQSDVANTVETGKSDNRYFVSYKGFNGDDNPVGAGLFLRKGLNLNRGRRPSGFIKKYGDNVVNDDFIHKMSGSRDGQFKYAIKTLFTELKINADISTGEAKFISISNIQDINNAIRIGVSIKKMLSLEIVNRLGTGQDYIRLLIDRIFIDADKELHLNIRPGSGGLDIVTTGHATRANVTIETAVGDEKQTNTFSITLNRGLRLQHSAVHTQGILQISRIDSLFGVASDLDSLYAKGKNSTNPEDPQDPPEPKILKWSNWQSLGGKIIGAPAAVTITGTPVSDLYVAGTDGALWQKWWDGNNWVPSLTDWISHDPFRMGGSPVALSSQANNRHLFIRGEDGSVNHKYWDGNQWNGWINLGGIIIGSPAVVAIPDTPFIDIYVKGTDGAVWQKWWDGNNWAPSQTGWIRHDDTFRLGSSPVAISTASNNRHLFARGEDGAVYQKYYDGSGWSGWFNLGGNVIDAPVAVAVPGTSVIDLYAKGADGALWQKWWDGQNWVPSVTDWIRLDDSLTLGSAPLALSRNANDRQLFVRGRDGQVYQKYYDGTQWSGWIVLGGNIIGTPGAVAIPDSPVIDIYVMGEDGAIWQKWSDGQNWHPSQFEWDPHNPFKIGGDISAICTSASDRHIFIRGTDGGVYQRYWDGNQWNGWNNLEGKIIGTPSAVSIPGTPVIDIYVKGEDGTLWQRWWDGESWIADWIRLDNSLLLGSAPTALSTDANNRNIFARGEDGSVYWKSYNGIWWSSWDNIGGKIIGAPAAVAIPGTSIIDLYVKGEDGALWQKWWDGQNWIPSLTEWIRLDDSMQLGSAPVALSSNAANRQVYVRGEDGCVYMKYWG